MLNSQKELTSIDVEIFDAEPRYYYDINLPPLAIDQAGYGAAAMTFESCNFQGGIEFKEVNFKNGIYFYNCEFDKIVSFQNVSSDKRDPKVHGQIGSIFFNKCRFKEWIEISTTEISESLIFKECVFENGISLNNINVRSDLGYVELSKCNITQELEFCSATIKDGLLLWSNVFNDDCNLSQINCKVMEIGIKNIFHGQLKVSKCYIEDKILLDKSEFNQLVNFDLVEVKEEGAGLMITESNFEKSFEVNYHSATAFPTSGINIFNIKGTKFNNGFSVVGSTILGKDAPEIRECNISASSVLSGNISFSSLKIDQISLSGYNSTAKVTFRKIQVHSLIIHEFINEGGLIFSNFKPLNNRIDKNGISILSSLNASDSNLGKAQFFETDFGSFDTLFFRNVILTDISTYGVKWFTSKQFEEKETESYQNQLKEAKRNGKVLKVTSIKQDLSKMLQSKREIYRQLKFINQRQGDMPQALEFQAREMLLYKKILDHKKDRNRNEYWILFFSQSNNFGQSWTKAFLLMLLFSFLAYIPIGFLTAEDLDYTKFAGSVQDVLLNLKIVFWSNIKSWIVLLNPAHRIKDLNENIEAFSSWVYFWDIISRIVVSYFLFQIVTAFRKFNK